ncbi:glycosyltransferase [Aeromonas veronii]|uniref:glycosyltransferase family 2 protein n=1 Tax=Aeromonas veronii TaxID=654 RepID=UPI001FD699CF|nr:glycosyltransferase family 2 protein [Aeromonas veronii]MCJ8233321.1 glycosyltransferase [Aeromonas veronii]
MQNLKFSLVLATLGRVQQVEEFIKSISIQTYPLELIEVIIVDQNEDDRLNDIVTKYNNIVSITHVKSSVKGLSVNRNIGIKKANGDIICFPDDDCIYPCDAVSKVANHMSTSIDNFIMGRIYDPKKGKHSFRTWPLNNKIINKFNFYRLTSSITMFFRKIENEEDILFDVDFGVGAKNHSNEDAIYVYKHLLNNKKGQYISDIVIFHDDQPINSLECDKVKNYSYGFGRFIKKYRSFPLLCLFIMSLLFQMYGAIKSLLIFDLYGFKLRTTSMMSRFRGLYDNE